MASWIIHLRIADALLHHLNVETSHFLAGNIAPDCGLALGNDRFDPPSSVTHYTTGGKADCDYLRFWEEFGKGETDPSRLSFYLGYFAHLMTDVLWSERINNPLKRRFRELYESDRTEFYRRVKADWYDLDFLYLRRNPDFPAWCKFLELTNYRNDFLPYYGAQHLPVQFSYIRAFYVHDKVDENRTFPYLSAQEADAFTEGAAADILRMIREICPICAK